MVRYWLKRRNTRWFEVSRGAFIAGMLEAGIAATKKKLQTISGFIDKQVDLHGRATRGEIKEADWEYEPAFLTAVREANR